MNNSKLQVFPQLTADSSNQKFNLIGTIDIDAIPVLESLYIIPEWSNVELDFAMVQRVNSMGLAQLLKLFKHWQDRNTSISVINTNRMIAVLFKMTGLNHYVKENSISSDSQPESGLSAEKLVETIHANPVHIAAPRPQDGKLKLWVSAQNSDQINGWYFFNTYLQRHLGRDIQLVLQHGAMSEQNESIDQMDIVFTKPFEAVRLLLEHGFYPLLRPVDQTDEVTLLVRADDARQKITDFHSGKVVTAASDNFVYLLGRFLLEESGDLNNDLSYYFSGHDIKALQMLLKGNADILFMLSDTYRGLSGLTKKMLREIDQSETAFAFHLFCVAPNSLDLGKAISNVLLKMKQDRQGQQVLHDLNITDWIQPKSDEIQMMEMLFKRYASSMSNPGNMQTAKLG